MPEDSDDANICSIEGLAKHLSLSRWTVSRILNGHKGVREDTRQRVLAEVERLGFQPNIMARSLRGTKTGLVGVCLQGIDSPILARKISSIQTALHKRGLRGVMEVTSGRSEAERSIVNHFLSLKVDGIVLVGSVLQPKDMIFARLKDEGASVVAVDPAWNVPLPRVEVDRHAAMRLCLRHLLKRGRKSFAMLGLESDPVYGVRRIEGLRAVAESLGLSWEKDFISIQAESQSEWSFEYGYSMAQELFQKEVPPQGIIALNDEVAIGAMKAIKEWGYSVPEDFSVVGFDNLDIGKWIEPSLTSIAQNVDELIEKSIGMMQTPNGESSEGDFPVFKVLPRLIVRGSS